MACRDGPLILVFAAAFMAFASPTILYPVRSRYGLATLEPRAVDDCTTDLAKDLYGLGVRLGVYFQWFTGWAANTFVLEEIAGALDANAIFMFALLISIVNSTKTNDMTQMDSLIMIQLCAGSVWTVLSLWGYRTCVYRKEGLDGIKHFGGFGTHLRLLLGAALSWYAVWFYIVGVKGLPEGLGPFSKGDPPPNCSLKEVIVFNRPLADPTIRYGALTASIVWLIYSTFVTIASPLAAITRAMKMFQLGRGKKYATTSRLRYATGVDVRSLSIMSWAFSVLDFLLVVFMMTLIELTLNINNAVGVLGANRASDDGHILTPSQLLPMLVGAFSFVRLLFTAWELWRSGDGDISPSLGRHDSRRGAKPKRDSVHGVNALRLFSGALEDTETAEGHETQENHFEVQQHKDPYFELQKRLKGHPWQRFAITWLPWLSLLYFWPWTKDRGELVPQDEAEMQLKPQDTSTNARNASLRAQWDDENDAESIDTSYRRPSHASAYEPQRPAEAT